jgi:predicted dehydrogenase
VTFSKINILIHGYGSIGKKHYAVFLKFLKPEQIFVITRKKIVKKNFFKKFSEIKKKINLVIICSPSSHHVKHSIFYAKKNINIFVEKPLSNSLEKKNINILKKILLKNKIFFEVGYVFKHDICANFIKKYIQKNSKKNFISINIVNRSFLPNWRKTNYKKTVSAIKKFGGGIVNELSHELHYANWFFKNLKFIKSKIYYSKKLNINVESVANILFFLKKNVPLNILLDWQSKKNQRYCEINFREETITWNLIKNEVYLSKNNFKKKKLICSDKDKYINQNYNLLKCINKVSKPKVLFDEALNVVRLISMIKKFNLIKKKFYI